MDFMSPWLTRFLFQRRIDFGAIVKSESPEVSVLTLNGRQYGDLT